MSRPLGRWLTLLVVMAVSLAGCAVSQRGDDPPPEPFEPLISQEDLGEFEEGTPERAVLDLWYYAQLGSVPNVVRLYHNRVRREIRDDQIAGTYDMLRPTLVESRLTPVLVEETPSGTLLTAQIESTMRDGERIPAAQQPHKTIESFLLRERRGEWQILYDTVLETSLPSYIQVVRGPFGEDEEREANRATREGRSLARAYRILFADSPDQD